MELAFLSAILGLNVLLLALVLAVLFRKKNEQPAQLTAMLAEQKASLAALAARFEALGGQLADDFERSRRESGQFQKDIRAEITESLRNTAKELSEMKVANAEHQRRLVEKVAQSLDQMRTGNAEQNERQSRLLAEAIGRMQESNEKKLDQMRATVDEKLNETLATRLGESFTAVSKQLENVNKSLGEMKELSSGVTDNVTSLNRVLTNVKARGTWAEVQLEGILDQTIPNMYEKNFATGADTGERVEFAIKIPSGDENKEITYLPIDSKFPMEDFVRLCDAADRADAEAVQRARKALETRVLAEAKTITKYIRVPRTTPFAIMYLATEGLYAEIASSRTGLPERLQKEFNIMIAGPTTITALLNSLSMGFRAVAINDKANEVRTLLAATKVQYDKFGDMLDKAKRKIDEAGRSLDDARDRNRIIQSKLKSVDRIEYTAADEILGIPSPAEDDEA